MATYIDTSMKTWEFEYRQEHRELNKKYDEILELARQILPRGRFQEYVDRQHDLSDTVDRVESTLLAGFKHEARAVLKSKLSRDQVEELLTLKYDAESALVLEGSVTEAMMTVSDVEAEMVRIIININSFSKF